MGCKIYTGPETVSHSVPVPNHQCYIRHPGYNRPQPLPSPTNKHTVKIMSFNLFGWSAFRDERRTESMAQLVRQEAPDILGSQEVEGQLTWWARKVGMSRIDEFGKPKNPVHI